MDRPLPLPFLSQQDQIYLLSDGALLAAFAVVAVLQLACYKLLRGRMAEIADDGLPPRHFDES